MTVYKLSDAGRAMLWRDYQAYGYGLSDLARWSLSKVFGPIAHWPSDLTLARIEDAHAAAGREIAWAFNEVLKLPVLAIPYTFSENAVPDTTGFY
jgi:hypothetical protein